MGLRSTSRVCPKLVRCLKFDGLHLCTEQSHQLGTIFTIGLKLKEQQDAKSRSFV